MKQVIVLRKDLNMRKGKMVAQGAHASLAVILDAMEKENGRWTLDMTGGPIAAWLEGRFTKVCVGVESEAQLLNIYCQAKLAGTPCALIRDAGLTEFGGVPTHTAVAVGPDTDERIDPITGNLPLL